MEGIFVPIAFFAMIAAIFVLPNYFKSRERIALQETLKSAYQNGQPVPQDVIDAITKGGTKDIVIHSPIRDIRGGIIWLAVALGVACMAYAMGYQGDTEEAFWPMIGLAAIPGVVGLALIALGVVGLTTQKKS